MNLVRACFVSLSLLLTIGCGSAMPGNNNSNNTGNNNGGSTNATPSPVISGISPSNVAAGSSDLTITINGSSFGHFGHFISSTAFWTTSGNLHDTGTWLQTTIVSQSQVTAVIPAALLQAPTSVQIVVMNGDVQGMSDGYFGYPRSNVVTFTVTP